MDWSHLFASLGAALAVVIGAVVIALALAGLVSLIDKSPVLAIIIMVISVLAGLTVMFYYFTP